MKFTLDYGEFDRYVSSFVLDDHDLPTRQEMLIMIEVSRMSCCWCAKSCFGHKPGT
jgi:hypothetical protein